MDAPAVRPYLGRWASWFMVGWLLMAGVGGLGAAEGEKSALDYGRDLESSEAAVQREAAYQLSRMGKAAEPALGQLIEALGSDEQQVWFGAVDTLAQLGPAAAPALPALVRELENWQPSRRGRQGGQALYRTAVALGAIGPEAVSVLEGLLGHSRWHVRAGALMALGFVGEPARPLIPKMVVLTGDGRVEVAEAAMEALVAMGRPAVGPLLDALSSSQAPAGVETELGLRLGVIRTLGRLGAEAESALDVLGLISGSRSVPEERVAALESLVRVDVAGEKVLPWLLAAWRSGEPPDEVHLAAKRALLVFPRVDGALIPAVIQDLQSENGTVRGRALALVTELGTDAGGVVNTLVAELDQGSGPAMAEMQRALGAVGPVALARVYEALRQRGPAALEAPEHWGFGVARQVTVLALPVLMSGMGDASPAVRAAALEGVAQVGMEARGTAGPVTALLGDPVAGVRSRAWRAAARSGLDTGELLARLDSALEDPDPEVRRAVVGSVALLGEAAKPAVPALIRELASPDAEMRLAAVRALGALGASSSAAVPTLVQDLNRDGRQGTVERLDALGRIGAASASGLGELLTVAGSEDAGVREGLWRAVASMGEAGREALEGVRKALVDEAPGVRAAAVRALGAVDPGSPETVDAVVWALEDGEAGVRRAAGEVLAGLGVRGRPAEERLFALLETGDRPMARDTLRAIHPTSLEHLLRALGHSDWTVREMAVDGLARLGKGAEAAIPALEKVMREDDYEEVKRACRRALRRIREG
jgi:HEAT repeat protein